MCNKYYLYDLYCEYLESLKPTDDAQEVTALSFQDWISAAGENAYCTRLVKAMTPAYSDHDYDDLEEDQRSVMECIENHDKMPAKNQPFILHYEAKLIEEAYCKRKNQNLYTGDLDDLYQAVQALNKVKEKLTKSSALYGEYTKEASYCNEDFELVTVKIPAEKELEEADELPF